MQERFEDANPGNELSSGDTLLPEGVLAQHALWQFDKGGDLQDLLHLLKYERLTTVGIDLGRELGKRVHKHPFLSRTVKEAPQAVILPVPLHYLKFRYRGFNQAFKIAKGFQEAWPDIPLCDIKSVVRRKNTRTQTGFSLEKRLQNIEDAFRVKVPSVVDKKLIIIIDDVFTTGATTFELAQTVRASGAESVVVLTVAQA
ncbi:ComF family protein [Aliifodinibius sp. 1BSP15-2V2]|uniref:ComF family protein n=1 Tax=Fodinibius salsisoli TaxID=2820877 RepID=A0ABT3PSL6_9BACT|nr:ComF family protein [Fodinibius salsisoli]